MFVTKQGNEQLYTRAGAFTFDNTGTLVGPTGNRVQGYALDSSTVPSVPTGDPVDVTLDTTNLNPPVPAGVSMTSYTIGSDGKITGVFDDGQQRDIAQIAIADFANPMGLEKVGETSYRESSNSGTATVGVAGQGRNGTLVGGSLEMSNVDLAAEFTNLILAQRGFQASSKVITTSDQVLQDLVNIKQ
jgi:flagellar hook protein FlgE